MLPKKEVNQKSPKTPISKTVKKEYPIIHNSSPIALQNKTPKPQTTIPKPQKTIPQKTNTKSQKTNTKKTTPQLKKNPSQNKIEYKHIEKENLSQALSKIIPKEFIPTTKTATILGYIFLAVVVLSLFQFPYREILSGNIETPIEVGYPLKFLDFSMSNIDNSPLKPKGLFLDILIYLILAYAIDVIINLTIKTPIINSKKKIEQPKIFKNIKPTMAEKFTKKVLIENNPKIESSKK